MPRVLRATFVLTPFVLLGHIYVANKLYGAAIQHLPVYPQHLRFALAAAIGYLILHPLLLLFLSLIGFRKAATKLTEGRKWWDLLFGYPFWFGFVLLGEVAPWFLAFDLLKLPFYPLYSHFKGLWLTAEARVLLVLFGLLSLYTLWKVIFHTVRIKVSRALLTYRNLPFSLDGLKIVHISDVQADSRTGKRRIRRFVRKINAMNPDLVFFTGDLVTSEIKTADSAARLLGKIKARHGHFACLGDHDVWTDKNEVIRALRANGIAMIEDSNQFIRVGNESLLVTFLTNVYSKRPNLDKVNFLMGQQPRGVLDILITHQPSESIIESAAERGYHIFLAGHTHGGQIVFRVFGMTLATPRLESRYYRGRQHLERMLISVNNGLGFTLAPIRYNAPAEITLIKLIRQPG